MCSLSPRGTAEHKALPLDLAQARYRALAVRVVACVVAEVELCEVLSEVVATNVMVDAVQPPLQIREVALYRVRVNVSTDVFFTAVIDRLV